MKANLHLWIVCGPLDLPETHLFATLARRGIVLTVFHSEEILPERAALIREAGGELIPLPIRNRLDLRASRLLRAEFRKRPCDLVYAPFNRALAAVLRAAPPRPRVKVIGYRGTIGHLTRWDPSSWLTYFHPRLDHIVAVSDAVRDYLVDRARFPASKVTRIYKGHDPAWYDEGVLSAPLPEADGTALTLCFTGKIRPVKGVVHLLDAMRLLPADLDARLLLVGELADRTVARRLARGTEPRVRHLGFRRDIPAILARTDIFLMPTVRREGLARSVIEAMARRIPCIVSDVGGLPELVVDGKTGLVVPPADPRAIAEAIATLARDKGLRDRLGAAARERVETVFDIGSTVAAFDRLFSGLPG